MNNLETHEKLGFLTGSKVLLFSPEKIIRLEAESNYSRIYFTDHTPILMAKVLRQYEAVLGPLGFIRTHKSHLVNRRHIVEFDRAGTIIMADQSQAIVSRRRRSEVFKLCLA